MRFEQVIPILRIFSVQKAVEFYRDFLGFVVDWEDRFDAAAPVYMQVARDGLLLQQNITAIAARAARSSYA